MALSDWRSRSGRGSVPAMTTAPNPYRGFRFPAEIIEHAVWLYHCFSLSLRDVELILAARGIVVSYESIREWGLRQRGARIGLLVVPERWARQERAPLLTPDARLAFQAELGPTPSYLPPAAPGHELARLRGRAAPARELDGVVHGRGDRGVGS